MHCIRIFYFFIIFTIINDQCHDCRIIILEKFFIIWKQIRRKIIIFIISIFKQVFGQFLRAKIKLSGFSVHNLSKFQIFINKSQTLHFVRKKTFLLQIDKKYTIMSAQKKLLSYYYCQAFNNNRFYKHKERLPGLILIK